MINDEKIVSLSDSMGIQIAKDYSKSATNTYYPEHKVIFISQLNTTNKRIIACSHELGHAIQSPLEFEKPINPNNEEKNDFIIAVERDAWYKGEMILKKLYPNLDEEFWDEFYSYKEYCLNTYEKVDGEARTNELFNGYLLFLYVYHADVKPNTEFNLFIEDLEISKPLLTLQ